MTKKLKSFFYNKLKFYWHVYQVYKSRLRLRIYGRGMLHDVHAFFTEQGIRYFIDYGTLLGAIREKHFISHDNDIDISVFADDVSPKKVLEGMKAKGFSFFRALEYNGIITEIVFCRHNVHCDIFFQFVEGTRQWVQGAITEMRMVNGCPTPQKLGKRRYRSLVTSCNEIDFMGTKLLIPSNFEEILEQTYGCNWRIPMVDWIAASNNDTRKNILITDDIVNQVDEDFIKDMKS